MTKNEACNILGVTLSASASQLRSAYRSRAKEYHPDICRRPLAAEEMARVNMAYETLTNPSGILAPALLQDFGDLFGESLDDFNI